MPFARCFGNNGITYCKRAETAHIVSFATHRGVPFAGASGTAAPSASSQREMKKYQVKESPKQADSSTESEKHWKSQF